VYLTHSNNFFLTLDFSVVNINRDGFALDIIPLICKNWLNDMKMGNVFHSLLVTPTIPTIKVVDPLAS
jgi:hypothetical protein